MHLESKKRGASIEKRRSSIKLGEYKRSLSASKTSDVLSSQYQPKGSVVQSVDARIQWTYANLSNNTIKNISSEQTMFPNDLLTDYIDYVYKNYRIPDPKVRRITAYTPYSSAHQASAPGNLSTPIKDISYDLTASKRSEKQWESNEQKSSRNNFQSSTPLKLSNYNSQFDGRRGSSHDPRENKPTPQPIDQGREEHPSQIDQFKKHESGRNSFRTNIGYYK